MVINNVSTSDIMPLSGHLYALLRYKYSESRAQRQIEKQSFSGFGYAEAHPILFKYSESRVQRQIEKQSFSGFDSAEAHPILFKYSESRVQRLFQKQSFSGFGYAEAQHIHFSNIENTLRKAKPPYRRTDIYTESIPPFGHIARLAGYKKDARKGVLLFSRRTGRG